VNAQVLERHRQLVRSVQRAQRGRVVRAPASPAAGPATPGPVQVSQHRFVIHGGSYPAGDGAVRAQQGQKTAVRAW